MIARIRNRESCSRPFASCPAELGAARLQAERGAVLVVVLLFLVTLATLATGFATVSRGEVERARSVTFRVRADAVVQAAVARAVVGLAEREREARWRADGRLYRWNFDGDEVEIRVTDEAGKIDLNAAEPELLEGLVKSVGLTAESGRDIVDAIIDWRDTDDSPQLHGAEAEDYVKAGRTGAPANRPFHSIEELRRLLPMDDAQFAKLVPLVTVYKGVATVDPVNASSEVLMALPGVTQADVARVLKLRLEPKPPDGTAIAGLLAVAQKYLKTSEARIYRIVVRVSQPEGLTATVSVVVWLSDESGEGETTVSAGASAAAAAASGGDHTAKRPYRVLDWSNRAYLAPDPGGSD